MRGVTTALLLVASIQTATAAGVKWDQAPQGFLANTGPRGTISYKVGNEPILRLPLVWTEAARIDAPVTFSFSGESVTIPAGTVLPAVTLTEPAAPAMPRRLYCTPSKVKTRTRSGSLWAMMQNKLINSLSDSQKCLEDTDGDGKLDHTLMVGEGKDDLRPGSQIDAISFAKLSNAEIGPTDYVTLELASAKADSATIILRVYQGEKPLQFIRVSQGPYTAEAWTKYKSAESFNRPLELFGIRFEILSTDPGQKSATIRWPEDAPRDSLPLIPTDLYLVMR